MQLQHVLESFHPIHIFTISVSLVAIVVSIMASRRMTAGFRKDEKELKKLHKQQLQREKNGG